MLLISGEVVVVLDRVATNFSELSSEGSASGFGFVEFLVYEFFNGCFFLGTWLEKVKKKGGGTGN
jgi:hypothetical protein